MVDMYALSGGNNFGTSQQVSQPGAGNDDEYGNFGMAVQTPIVTVSGGANVDHIARNAFISSQYRYMSGIRSQINQDMLYTRLFNSQQRAQILDS